MNLVIEECVIIADYWTIILLHIIIIRLQYKNICKIRRISMKKMENFKIKQNLIYTSFIIHLKLIHLVLLFFITSDQHCSIGKTTQIILISDSMNPVKHIRCHSLLYPHNIFLHVSGLLLFLSNNQVIQDIDFYIGLKFIQLGLVTPSAI
ncbi:hypothetical protein pb186bvf_007251 [Paramecium bursaria]